MTPLRPVVSLDSDELTRAISDWIQQEIKASSARYYDLGKFLFSVSAASMIYFATVLQALGGHSCSIPMLVIATALLTAAIFVSILIVWPPSPRITGSFDVLLHFNAEIQKRRRLFLFWVLGNMAGMMFGILSLIHVERACMLVSSLM